MDGDMVLPITPQVSVASTLSMDDEERLERNDSEFKRLWFETPNFWKRSIFCQKIEKMLPDRESNPGRRSENPES